jgi:uncharacterized membrane-anchored protein
MTTPATTAADEIVTLTQMAESYRSLAFAGTHYAADLTGQIQRNERTIDGLRERLAERDARIVALEAEITRYTRSQVAASEAA